MVFRSLTEQMDTTTPSGQFLFSLVRALARHERADERVRSGLATANAAGLRKITKMLARAGWSGPGAQA